MEEEILDEQTKKKKKVEEEIIVNGESISSQQFEELQSNKKFKLKKLSENTYKKLELLHG